MTKRILIIGGTGVFGKRLARHLSGFDGITLYVSSRSLDKATAFVKTLKAETPDLQAYGVALDHRKNLSSQLETIKPFAVIDCSGPFQTANYDAARIILSAKSHLIDLADAHNYLAGYSGELDALARANDVCAATGASSTPTLSSCVVHDLIRDWQRVDTIDISITPGGKSEVGRSVIEAILSYAGKPISAWRDGQIGQTTGWTGARSVHIPNLGRRRVAPVETYDAEHLGPRHNVQSRVSFAAGLESRIEQFGIEAIANLRRKNLFPNPAMLIPALLKARRITRIPTSDCGGMIVEISGIDHAGASTNSTWSLVARNDHGPFIPILPAAAVLQNLLNGNATVGAGLAAQYVTLSDILSQMIPYDIACETAVVHAELSPFETYFGKAGYAALPRAVQDFHTQCAPPIWTGLANVETGKGLIGRLIGKAFGFPKASKDVPLTVRVDHMLTPSGQAVERWTRVFAGKVGMSSVLMHKANGQFTEAFAPFSFDLGLSGDAEGIKMPVVGWQLGKLPLPDFLAPRSETLEYQDDQGRFCFDVRLTVPFFGLLAHYKGWLRPAVQ